MPSKANKRNSLATLTGGWNVAKGSPFFGYCDICDDKIERFVFDIPVDTTPKKIHRLCSLHAAIWDAGGENDLEAHYMDLHHSNSLCAECDTRFFDEGEYLCRKCR